MEIMLETQMSGKHMYEPYKTLRLSKIQTFDPFKDLLKKTLLRNHSVVVKMPKFI